MLNAIETINTAVNNFIWGVPAMVCIIGVGLYLSIRTGFLQIRKFPYAIRTTIGRMFRKKDASDGAITPFQAVCTALAATVGTGNIAGVAGALAIGGPGAVFWMWFLPCSVCVPNFLKLPWQSSFAKPMRMESWLADLCTILRTDCPNAGTGLHIFLPHSVY